MFSVDRGYFCNAALSYAGVIGGIAVVPALSTSRKRHFRLAADPWRRSGHADQAAHRGCAVPDETGGHVPDFRTECVSAMPSRPSAKQTTIRSPALQFGRVGRTTKYLAALWSPVPPT